MIINEFNKGLYFVKDLVLIKICLSEQCKQFQFDYNNKWN